MKVMDQFQLPDPNNVRRDAEIILMLISYTVNGVCSTDLRDQYCMIKLQAQPTDYTCAGMENYLKTVGCCAPSALEFAQGLCNVDKTLRPAMSTCQAGIDGVNAQLATCPNLKLGQTCALLKYLLIHQALITGVAPAWFAIAANKLALIEEVKKVIAFAVGIEIARLIEIKIVAATVGTGRRLLQTGDLQVTTNITVPHFAASKSATQGLMGELDSLGVNDAIQESTIGGTLGQPTITGQSTTNIARVNENDAASVAPMFVVALACIFLQ
jgi:hypothetical protein